MDFDRQREDESPARRERSGDGQIDSQKIKLSKLATHKLCKLTEKIPKKLKHKKHNKQNKTKF